MSTEGDLDAALDNLAEIKEREPSEPSEPESTSSINRHNGECWRCESRDVKKTIGNSCRKNRKRRIVYECQDCGKKWGNQGEPA